MQLISSFLNLTVSIDKVFARQSSLQDFYSLVISIIFGICYNVEFYIFFKFLNLEKKYWQRKKQ